MKRREFIGIAAAGAAGLVVPAVPGDRNLDRVATLAVPRLLAVVHDPRIVDEIGRRYRERVPTEDAVPALATALLGDADAGESADLAGQLDAQVRRDFAQGRTLTLDGWVVALTEARQCALHSLVRA